MRIAMFLVQLRNFLLHQRENIHPCDASKEQLFELRDFLGFERSVIVQATCHGNNNDALEDALIYSNGMAGVLPLLTKISIARL